MHSTRVMVAPWHSADCTHVMGIMWESLGIHTSFINKAEYQAKRTISPECLGAPLLVRVCM